MAVLASMLAATNVYSYDKMLSTQPETSVLIDKFCHEKHWRNQRLIYPCVDQQLSALSSIETYQVRNYPNVSDNHPVNMILVQAVTDNPVIVDGKPWADWFKVKFQFKRKFQDWLKVQGKRDSQLDNI